MTAITTEFVCHWAANYDRHYRGTLDEKVETHLREWLAALPEPKYLDMEHFVCLCRWKTPRQTSAYKSNDATLVEEATRLAYVVQNEYLKLHVLLALRGVGVPVASTILHFLLPGAFPIFDVHARGTLAKVGTWTRSVGDARADAWMEYVAIMRKIAHAAGVGLRELDKALYAYDKWGEP
ncbi:MAG: hypothetical protein Q8O40_05275 [Chloroflexota bacterium]|nr:hypothetical protein [Chloroflexota bacterium]